MYFPYLRGRQFELIAIRELIDKSLLSEKIVPIIEPVKLSASLIKTVQVFVEAGREIALVQNPQVGNFIADWNKEKSILLRNRLGELIDEDEVICVRFLDPETERAIASYSKKGKSVSDLITICINKDYIPLYDEIFTSDKPRYNLMPDENVFRRRIRDNRVMIDDKFNKLSRNIDYADVDDEPFSDDHLYYSEDGYKGFSDYSIIGDEYNETGFAPYAVAIHIVYFDDENSLRIKHFVSDSNDDITDPAGKFAEAVGKLVKWNRAQKLSTFGINALTENYKNEFYPGLGTVKKLSLMHHFELMGAFLDKEQS